MANKKYDHNQQQFGAKLFAAYPEYGRDADEVFAKIAALDPSATQKAEKNQYIYLQWICSRVMKDQPRQQDLYKIKEDLETYHFLAGEDKRKANDKNTTFYKPTVEAQIGQYDLLSLSAAVLPAQAAMKERDKTEEVLESERTIAEREAITLYNGPEGRIVVPLTTEASQYWGKATKWCISATKGDNYFEAYNNDGTTPILMFLPKGTTQKYAFNEHDQSAARDMLDQAISKYSRGKTSTTPDVEILGQFIKSVFESPNFEEHHIHQDPRILKACQLFALWNPPVHEYLVEKMGEDKLPDFMRIKNLAQFCAGYTYLDNPEAAHDDLKFDSKQELVRHFLMSKPVLKRLISGELPDHLGRMYHADNYMDALHIVESIAFDHLMVPDKPFATPEEYLADFTKKLGAIQKVEEVSTEHFRGALSEKSDEAIAQYMQSVPEHFWDDEEFAAAFSQAIGVALTIYVEAAPKAYNHPKLLADLLRCCDLDVFSDAIKKIDLNNGWRGKIDGTPVVEIAMTLRGPRNREIIKDIDSAIEFYDAIQNKDGVDLSPLTKKLEGMYPEGLKDIADIKRIATKMPLGNFSALLEKSIKGLPGFSEISDIASAVAFYKSIGNIDGLDLLPIAKRIEDIYPQGFDNADDIETVSFEMPKCDFTQLLEKSVQHDPALFADIAPDKQTLPMAIAAVQHDPGSLADIASHLFKGTTRPPELTAAFNKLPPDSLEWAAVVDYFTVPEVR